MVYELYGFLEYRDEVRSFKIDAYSDLLMDCEFYLSGEVDRDFFRIEKIVEEFGDIYYESLEDYKKGNKKSITEFFENN